MKSKIIVALLALSVIFAAGCRTAPVYSVDNAAVGASGKHTTSDVGKAIIRAGNSLGWQMKKVSPGKIIGTLHLRKHMAQVEITYNSKAYSINYKDSAELHYDGSTIHSNYNGWVQNLNRSILTQFNTM